MHLAFRQHLSAVTPQEPGQPGGNRTNVYEPARTQAYTSIKNRTRATHTHHYYLYENRSTQRDTTLCHASAAQQGVPFSPSLLKVSYFYTSAGLNTARGALKVVLASTAHGHANTYGANGRVSKLERRFRRERTRGRRRHGH